MILAAMICASRLDQTRFEHRVHQHRRIPRLGGPEVIADPLPGFDLGVLVEPLVAGFERMLMVVIIPQLTSKSICDCV